MSLLQKIDEDIKTAMKAKEAPKLETLRMAKAAITNTAIAKKKEHLEDSEILEVLEKQVKQRKESYDCFKNAGRQELAQKEQYEMQVLQQYLPKQLTEEEIKGLVEKAIASTGAKGAGEAGKVMKELMPLVKGKADGKFVNQVVLQLLK